MFPSIKSKNFELFVNGLTKLKPILQELSSVTRIVWMQQAPLLDTINTKNSHFFFTKYHHYNSAMRDILK
jgi:hypothetical protein